MTIFVSALSVSFPKRVCFLIFAVFLVVFAFSGFSHAKVSILESGKIKTIQQQEQSKNKGGQVPPDLFHSDPDDPANQFEPGELLIANAPRGFVGQLGNLGYQLVEQIELGAVDLSLAVVQIPRGKSVPEAVRELTQRFPGIMIDANHLFEVQASGETARGAMGWPDASPDCGTGVRLGMIDSGVDTTHVALKNQKIEFVSFHSKGRNPGPMVHGTAIAAILVGKSSWGGLLPGAQLFAASMFETDGNGRKVGSARGLLKSLNWLAQMKVDAVNLSVAGTDNKILRLAFENARKRGMILVAAAGNWGRADKPAYPAAYKHVVAITAVNSRKLIYSHANTGRYIDFAAPGVRIFTAVPGGSQIMSGTSFASPYVAALFASEIAYGGRYQTSALKKALQRKAVDLGRKGKDTVFGYGFVHLQPRCK